MVEELVLSTPHLALAARAWGPVTGKPVLALHGWLDNAASFDALAPLLNGVRLVALDLPGHGHSEHRPAGTYYHLLDYIQDVVQAADALGWERFSLLGHSLGAGIASFVAAGVARRIRRLALIEGLGPLSADPQSSASQFTRAVQQRLRGTGNRPAAYASLQAAATARCRGGDLGFDAAMVLAGRGTKATSGGLVWRSDPRLRFLSPLYMTEVQVRCVLSGISCPTYLVIAESGYLKRRDYMLGRYECMENIQLETLPGGHHLHMDHPRALAQSLSTFLMS